MREGTGRCGNALLLVTALLHCSFAFHLLACCPRHGPFSGNESLVYVIMQYGNTFVCITHSLLHSLVHSFSYYLIALNSHLPPPPPPLLLHFALAGRRGPHCEPCEPPVTTAMRGHVTQCFHYHTDDDVDADGAYDSSLCCSHGWE